MIAVHFKVGKHYGYQFDADGNVTAVKPYTLSRNSGASADTRGQIPDRPGTWLHMVNGIWAGYYIHESAVTDSSAVPEAQLPSVVVEPPPPPPPPATFPATGRRPYTDTSPWNTPISNPVVHPNSAAWIAGIATAAQPVLRSDPTQFSMPLYWTDGSAPRDLLLRVKASVQNADGSKTVLAKSADGFVHMPGVLRGTNLVPCPGSDSQIILGDPVSGDELDVWQFDGDHTGSIATLYKGGLFRTGADFTSSYDSRGGGVPYLAGLLRPWELLAGKIEHALTFAYHSASPNFVAPASKSDGKNAAGMPEGARLQLDPAFDVSTLSGPTRIIATALQVYGMFLIDVSGSNKVGPEAAITAKWGTAGVPVLDSKTVNAIPIARLRVIL